MAQREDIKITLYEPWMHGQIIRMVCNEYGGEEDHHDKFYKNFYDHPYQREKCIRIVAKDGEKVVGFQSFFSWPYLLDGRIMNSYQSGNSLVDSNYRGKGIFQGLLNYLDVIQKDKKVDFLIGFPVKASYNSLIRNKWSNILNLKWYVKITSPFSIFQRPPFAKLSLAKTPEPIPGIPTYKGFTLSRDPDFETWRKYYSGHNHYFYFNYTDGGHCVRFNLKVNLRGIMKELIVGRVQTNCDDLDFLGAAVKALVRKAREERVFTFLSVALNDQYYRTQILMAFRQAGFIRINKQIYFLVKDFSAEKRIFQRELWELYRSDIDTW